MYIFFECIENYLYNYRSESSSLIASSSKREMGLHTVIMAIIANSFKDYALINLNTVTGLLAPSRDVAVQGHREDRSETHNFSRNFLQI